MLDSKSGTPFQIQPIGQEKIIQKTCDITLNVFISIVGQVGRTALWVQYFFQCASILCKYFTIFKMQK